MSGETKKNELSVGGEGREEEGSAGVVRCWSLSNLSIDDPVDVACQQRLFHSIHW